MVVFEAFGLRFRSALPLPRLVPVRAEAREPVDVEITLGEVPLELPGVVKRGVRFQAAPGALLLRVDGVATYHIEQGRRIVIARAPGADDDDVRIFLLSSSMAALLHQRGDLVLHGSAIAWANEAVLFLGRSGVGKSTIAAAFRKRGRSTLSDDLCVVRLGADGRMWASSGFPHAKLWADSLRKLDVSADGLRRVRATLEKRVVPLTDDFLSAALPIRKIYVLRDHNLDEIRIQEVQGPRKLSLLKGHTYHVGFLADLDLKVAHFQSALRLAQDVPLTAVARPGVAFRLDELAQRIEVDLEA